MEDSSQRPDPHIIVVLRYTMAADKCYDRGPRERRGCRKTRTTTPRLAGGMLTQFISRIAFTRDKISCAHWEWLRVGDLPQRWVRGKPFLQSYYFRS